MGSRNVQCVPIVPATGKCWRGDLIHLSTAVGLPPSGSSTVHLYTQTIHRTTQNKQYIEQHKHFGRVQAVRRLGELYPGICPTSEGESTEKPQSG